MKITNIVACAAILSLAAGCSSSSSTPDPDASYRQTVTTGMHDTLASQIDLFLQASKDLQAAAPTPAGRGWDATADATAMTQMQDAWKRVRDAYEKIEGAIAPLFPEVDFAIDARYDDFLAQLKGQGDDDPFDGKKVTGQHAIERILYVDRTPIAVVEFEQGLPGYKAAAMPATADEAAEFKSGLSAQLVTDVTDLKSQWQPAKIDLGGAFQGLVSLMNEQREKVNKAATHEEESRYSQRTLADLHANLDGTVTAYDLFKPWLLSKTGGAAIDGNIQKGFQDLRDAYNAYEGDAIPAPPATWNPDAPSAADLATDFGKLFVVIQAATDPAKTGSIVDQMNAAAKALGFPEFVEEP